MLAKRTINDAETACVIAFIIFSSMNASSQTNRPDSRQLLGRPKRDLNGELHLRRHFAMLASPVARSHTRAVV
jgi:hypothetical protein